MSNFSSNTGELMAKIIIMGTFGSASMCKDLEAFDKVFGLDMIPEESRESIREVIKGSLQVIADKALI